MENFTSFKNQIEDLANKILNQHNLRVYEINNFQDFESDVIQILVEDQTQPNKPLSFDILLLVNEDLSTMMDDIKGIDNQYLLEVASAGIEKPIRNEKELVQAIDQYVHIEFHQMINKIKSLDGTIISYDEKDKTFKIAFFVKGQKKQIDFTWELIQQVRYAVKF
ncbi:ribosome maturation factor RimP [Williamsoniiplasma luminosum]|uniref:Ribosome maturation factor RimP n=1 Tax=Williamsoniiplasma luminosum TaxID=214888 RepID=A0A2K8NTM5_9MOLU|nr:ribosome maturation factor RimP [Williamsoniiplasma luminosum]ATZ17190.1 ribosome maturation factor RimP [Williamsoniiplasma luminosum]